MVLNGVTAGIEIIGDDIRKLTVNNTLLNAADGKEKKISFNVNEPHFTSDEKGQLGQISIEIVIDIINNEEYKCHIEMELEGAFISTIDMDKEQFKSKVCVNGVAALVGIARGKIEAITSSVFNNGKITIPYINVLDYYKEVSAK